MVTTVTTTAGLWFLDPEAASSGVCTSMLGLKLWVSQEGPGEAARI